MISFDFFFVSVFLFFSLCPSFLPLLPSFFAVFTSPRPYPSSLASVVHEPLYCARQLRKRATLFPRHSLNVMDPPGPIHRQRRRRPLCKNPFYLQELGLAQPGSFQKRFLSSRLLSIVLDPTTSVSREHAGAVNTIDIEEAEGR